MQPNQFQPDSVVSCNQLHGHEEFDINGHQKAWKFMWGFGALACELCQVTVGVKAACCFTNAGVVLLVWLVLCATWVHVASSSK